MFVYAEIHLHLVRIGGPALAFRSHPGLSLVSDPRCRGQPQSAKLLDPVVTGRPVQVADPAALHLHLIVPRTDQARRYRSGVFPAHFPHRTRDLTADRGIPNQMLMP
jgi:hypothetical protein